MEMHQNYKQIYGEPTSTDNFDFLSACSAAQEYLLAEQEEEPLLYSVEQGELQPITSPFMVPGIYKKISTAPIAGTAGGTASAGNKCQNVFISEKERHGRIVHAKDFDSLYIVATAKGEVPAEYLASETRRVVLLEHMEDDEAEKITPSPALSTVKNNQIVQKQWDALSKLAYDILKLSNRDHIVIDRKLNEIVRTANGTNQKTIYRILSPESFGMSLPDSNEKTSETTTTNTEPIKPKSNKGRPRKTNGCAQNTKVSPKRKMPAKNSIQNVTQIEKRSQAILHTRSGRIVKTTQPTKQGVLTDHEAHPQDQSTTTAEFMRNFLAELRDSDYHCSQPLSPLKVATSETQPPLASSSPIKTVGLPHSSNCPTCNKTFVGKRLQRHFFQYPDHNLQAMPNDNGRSSSSQTQPELSLFGYLVTKLQKHTLSEDQRADLLLHEINDLVLQLQMRSSRLLRNTSGLHFVSARAARVLGIPEGQYALDMSAIESDPPRDELESSVETASLLNFNNRVEPVPVSCSVGHHPARSLDFSMSLDDTLTDEAAQKLNLSAGGKLLPPSEESLLRVVEDLVQTDMQKLSETRLLQPVPLNVGTTATVVMPHYDHASDNAVEAVSMKETTTTAQQASLDLAVDFFQFNNN